MTVDPPRQHGVQPHGRQHPRGLGGDGVLALALVGQRLEDRVLAVGLRWGLGVSLFGMILAVLMVNPINQAVLQAGQHPPALLDGGTRWARPTAGRGCRWPTGACRLVICGCRILWPPRAAAAAAGGLAAGSPRAAAWRRPAGLAGARGGVVYLGVVVLLVWQALRANR